jgi:Fungal protein kinase
VITCKRLEQVVTVARYYHHGTVCVGGEDDTIVDNVRKGLDIRRAKHVYKIISKMKEDDMKKQEDFAS